MSSVVILIRCRYKSVMANIAETALDRGINYIPDEVPLNVGLRILL
jgi:hypothetical protein